MGIDDAPKHAVETAPDPVTRWAIPVLTVVAAVFGLVGVGWGLSDIDPSWGRWVNPFEFVSRHPDEPLLVTGGLYFATGMDPAEKFFHWGGTGEFFVAQVIATVLLFPADATPETVLSSHSVGLILAGRMFSVAAGIVTVLLLYHVGAGFFNRRAGFVGALLFAVSGLYVETAAQFRPDLPSACGIALCLAGCASTREGRDWRGMLLSGIGAGVAAAFRGPNGIIVLVVAPALIQAARRSGPRTAAKLAAILAGAAAAMYALLSHQSLLHPGFAFSFFRRVGELSRGAFVESIGRDPLLWYAAAILPAQAIGPAATLGSYLGLVLGLHRRNRAVVPFAIGFVAFAVSLATLKIHMARYLLPLWVLLVLPCASLLCGSGPPPCRRRIAFLIAVIALTAATGVERLWLRTRQDTRAQAESWLDANLPPGPGLGSLTLGSVHSAAWPSIERHDPKLFVAGEYTQAHGFARLTDAPIDVWIVHEQDWRTVNRVGDRHPHREDARFLAGMRAGVAPDGSRWERIAAFGLPVLFPGLVPPRIDEPDDYLVVSPGIEIYRRRPR